MRPRSLDEFVGQSQVLGPGKPLRRAIESGLLHSLILWGPPGTGKTTLARLIAQKADAQFIALSAVMAGVKDIRAAVETARNARETSGRPTLLFLDEVHRFNKAQQDTFLPYLEDGTLTFVGATTENPSFEVVSAVLSRARVYVLRSLTVEDITTLLGAALTDEERGLGKEHLTAEPEALELIAKAADGDGRRALKMLELGAGLAEVSPEGHHALTLAIANAVVYLACAPKSNAVYVAMGEAMADVEKFGTLDVPLRFRNAPTGLMKNLGFGRDYRYAHEEPDAYVAGERYLPDDLPDRRYYRPVARGLELKIGEALARLRAKTPSKG